MVRHSNIMKIAFCMAILLIFPGCLRSVEIVKRERIDQDLAKGNRGVILGPVPTTPSKASPTRTYTEWDVEIPTYEMQMKIPGWHRKWHDKDLSGNRGYVMGGSQKRKREDVIPVAKEEAPPPMNWFSKPFQHKEETQELKETPAEVPTHTTYTVKKGETLGEISGKVYGTTKAWRRLYEANRDILKDPDHLRPGQVLKVPQGEPVRKSPSRDEIK